VCVWSCSSATVVWRWGTETQTEGVLCEWSCSSATVVWRRGTETQTEGVLCVCVWSCSSATVVWRRGTETKHRAAAVRQLCGVHSGCGQLKCDGTRAETRFRLSAKRTSPFKSAGASVQSTAGSRGVGIGGSDAAYTVFRGSVKSTGY
jgi:hypothetical protein